MGCNASNSNVKRPGTVNKQKTGKYGERQPPSVKKTVKIMDSKKENEVVKTDAKTGNTKIMLDLQFKKEDIQTVKEIAMGKDKKTAYQRFNDLDSISVVLATDENAAANKDFLLVIKEQFPATLKSLTLKSLAKTPYSLAPYVEALSYSKTHVTDLFEAKNFALDDKALASTLLAADQTKKVVLFGAVFKSLDKFEVNKLGKYTTQTLSVQYSKNDKETDTGSNSTIIAAIGKNATLGRSLTSYESLYNKLGSENEAKKAITDATLGKLKLSFKLAPKQFNKVDGDNDAIDDIDSQHSDSEAESDAGDDEEASEASDSEASDSDE